MCEHCANSARLDGLDDLRVDRARRGEPLSRIHVHYADAGRSRGRNPVKPFLHFAPLARGALVLKSARDERGLVRREFATVERLSQRARALERRVTAMWAGPERASHSKDR